MIDDSPSTVLNRFRFEDTTITVDFQDSEENGVGFQYGALDCEDTDSIAVGSVGTIGVDHLIHVENALRTDIYIHIYPNWYRTI